MNKTDKILFNEFGSAINDTDFILGKLCLAQSDLYFGNTIDEVILNAAEKAEILTDKLRRAVLHTAPSIEVYRQYEDNLVKQLNIRVELLENQILKIGIPALIPHRKAHTSYIYKPLHHALKQFKAEREFELFKECTVAFIHCYDKKLPKTRIRDHDNIEEKQVMDIIKSFYMESDNGLYADTYHTTRIHDSDATMIYVMDNKVFPEWIYSIEFFA